MKSNYCELLIIRAEFEIYNTMYYQQKAERDDDTIDDVFCFLFFCIISNKSRPLSLSAAVCSCVCACALCAVKERRRLLRD